MNAGETASYTLLSPQSLLDQRQDNVTIKMRGSVLRETGNTGLCGVPIALVLHVEVVGLLGESVQRIAEDGNALPRLNATELDVLFLDTLVGRMQCRSRAHVDGTCYASSRRIAPQIGVFAIKMQWQ